jgi:hypothetical protein
MRFNYTINIISWILLLILTPLLSYKQGVFRFERIITIVLKSDVVTHLGKFTLHYLNKAEIINI